MTRVKAYVRIMPRRWNGMKNLLIKGMLGLNTVLAICIAKARAYVRIMPRRWNGMKNRRIKEMLMLNTVLATCMAKA